MDIYGDDLRLRTFYILAHTSERYTAKIYNFMQTRYTHTNEKQGCESITTCYLDSIILRQLEHCLRVILIALLHIRRSSVFLSAMTPPK